MEPDAMLADQWPETYHTHQEGLVAARSVPADSAALYEAVNAYVDSLASDPWDYEEAHYSLLAFIDAAHTMANHRIQRRAAEREGAK